VALAVDDAREGPFVLVTLDGRFVTCLGRACVTTIPWCPAGRSTRSWPRWPISAPAARSRSASFAPTRTRRTSSSASYRGGVGWPARTFVAVSAFEPTLGLASWRLMLELSVEAAKLRPAMVLDAARTTVIKDKTARALERFDRLEWAVAHLMLLSCAGERPTSTRSSR